MNSIPPKDYWKNKSVIVSGGLGFIGSHFVEQLANYGATVICLYRSLPESGIHQAENTSNIRYIHVDLLDQRELEAVCKYVAPEVDCFIHSAALDGNTQYKLEHAAEIIDRNTLLVSNVLNSCRSTGINDVVLLSSAEIYSKLLQSGEISETDDFHKKFDYTENGYDLSKIFSEITAELHSKQYGMNIYLPRPTNVYGPGDSFDANTSRVIPSMIRKVATGQNIEIWGDGTQTRSFIYVKDLVNATLGMVQGEVTGPMNIATRDQVSILELANLISDLFGAKNAVNLDESKPTGAKARVLNVDKMYSVIDFEPYTLNSGLDETVRWFNQQRHADQD